MAELKVGHGLPMKKIVITGAAGFIGSHLARYLHKDGYELVLIDDLSFGYEDNLLIDGKPFAPLLKLDIRSPEIHTYIKGADCIFHMAAISTLPINQNNPGDAIAVNVAGTANILESARRGNVGRLVFASTSAIYENNETYPCYEGDAVAPLLVYSLGKWQAEQLCNSFSRIYGMEIVITRYYNVYGPHQDMRRKSPPFVAYVINELLQGRSPILHGDGEQRRDYVFLEDVTAINIACMHQTSAMGHCFNVASGKSYSVNEIYAIIADLIGTSIKPTFLPATQFWKLYPDLFAGNNPMNIDFLEKEVNKFTLGSSDKAEKILGWKALIPMEKGLSRCIDYALSQPYPNS